MFADIHIHFVVLLMGHTFPENVRINSVLSCFLIIFLVINIKIRDINLNPIFSIYKKYLMNVRKLPINKFDV